MIPENMANRDENKNLNSKLVGLLPAGGKISAMIRSIKLRYTGGRKTVILYRINK
jgi:hypothetical protein